MRVKACLEVQEGCSLEENTLKRYRRKRQERRYRALLPASSADTGRTVDERLKRKTDKNSGVRPDAAHTRFVAAEGDAEG